MKDLPIGVQTFKKIRENNYVYVDKTELLYAIAKNEGNNFLSRPRRFGKSLLVNTFKELFLGNEKLFPRDDVICNNRCMVMENLFEIYKNLDSVTGTTQFQESYHLNVLIVI